MRVAVVGAGFAGLISSAFLKEVAEVTLFEEHPEVGFPEHCTGIISGSLWKRLKNFVSDDVNEGYLSEFFLGLPDGRGVKLKGPKDFAAKLQRKRLEEELFDYVISEGVKFVNKLVVHVTPKGKVDGECYDKVVLAEGWRGELSNKLGIGASPRRVYGINLEVKGRVASPGSVEVWFDKKLAPGFFAWVVMLDDKAVVGTAAERGYNVRELAKKVLETAERRGLVEGKVVKEYGGVIQTGPPVKAPCLRKVCSTGDAAGLNKPVTGGGLYPSFRVAEEYPKNLKNMVKAYKIIPRLYVETLVARALHKAPQRLYERLFSELDGEVWKLSEYDNHVKSAGEVLRNLGARRTLRLLSLALRSFVF